MNEGLIALIITFGSAMLAYANSQRKDHDFLRDLAQKRDKDVVALQERNDKLLEQTTLLLSTVKERDKTIEDLTTTLKDKSKQLEAATVTVLEMQKNLESQEERINDLMIRVTALEAQIKIITEERDTMRAERDRAIQERDRAIQERDQALSELSELRGQVKPSALNISPQIEAGINPPAG